MDILDKAFIARPRQAFLPKEMQYSTMFDSPIPIGYGQTNSQPSLVYDMLDMLQLKLGLKVLDVGCGSGWTTSLISYLVGNNGFVTGTEIIPELTEFAKSNCNKFAVNNWRIINTIDQLGYKKESPYDRILVSANASELPVELIDQLSADGGIMVIPVNDQLIIVTKNGANITIDNKYGVVFIPLIKQ